MTTAYAAQRALGLCAHGTSCTNAPAAKPRRQGGGTFAYCDKHRKGRKLEARRWLKHGPRGKARTAPVREKPVATPAAEVQPVTPAEADRPAWAKNMRRAGFDDFMLKINHEEDLREAERQQRQVALDEAKREEQRAIARRKRLMGG